MVAPFHNSRSDNAVRMQPTVSAFVMYQIGFFPTGNIPRSTKVRENRKESLIIPPLHFPISTSTNLIILRSDKKWERKIPTPAPHTV